MLGFGAVKIQDELAFGSEAAIFLGHDQGGIILNPGLGQGLIEFGIKTLQGVDTFLDALQGHPATISKIGTFCSFQTAHGSWNTSR